METALPQRKPTMFNLNIDLLNRLKELARKEHCSLNSYVEGALFDIAYNEPNETTIASIKDACDGKYVGSAIDPTSVDSLLESAGV